MKMVRILSRHDPTEMDHSHETLDGAVQPLTAGNKYLRDLLLTKGYLAAILLVVFPFASLFHQSSRVGRFPQLHVLSNSTAGSIKNRRRLWLSHHVRNLRALCGHTCRCCSFFGHCQLKFHLLLWCLTITD